MARHLSFRPSFTLRGREFYGIRGWAGKPIHPMLTDFPIVSYNLAAAFDVLSLIARSNGYGWAHDAYVAATWAMIAGFAVSVLTATTGLLDWPATTRGTQVRRTVNAHATIMVTATLCAALTVVLRILHWPGTEGTIPLITALTVLVALLVATGGWIGNDLVFEHGFRVEPSRNTPAWDPSDVDILPGGQALDRYRWHWAADRRRANGQHHNGNDAVRVPVHEMPEWDTPRGVTVSGSADDVASRLRQLVRLRDEGVVTRSEFDSKKKELLARM